MKAPLQAGQRISAVPRRVGRPRTSFCGLSSARFTKQPVTSFGDLVALIFTQFAPEVEDVIAEGGKRPSRAAPSASRASKTEFSSSVACAVSRLSRNSSTGSADKGTRPTYSTARIAKDRNEKEPRTAAPRTTGSCEKPVSTIV